MITDEPHFYRVPLCQQKQKHKKNVAQKVFILTDSAL